MSAHKLPADLFVAAVTDQCVINDPGDAGTIRVHKNPAVCHISSAGAETRTLYPPSGAGILLLLDLVNDGGDCTMTVTNGYNQQGSTSLVFNDIGDSVLLMSVKIDDDGTDDYEWRLVNADGVNAVTGDNISLADSDQLRFGDGNDITMAWDGTDFDVLQATANSSIKWGVDGAGIDQVFYGDTASQSATWDQSADDLVLTSLVNIAGAGGTHHMMTPSALQEENPAAGAISITTFATQLDTAGAEAFTLADGAQVGQLKFIHMTVDAGDATLTPTNLADGTTIVFSNIGDAVLLRWDGAEWKVILRQNLATAAITTPVIGA